MKQTTNQEIRRLCRDNHVMLWQIADKLQIADTTLSKRLRRELPEDTKQEMLEAIKQILATGGESDAK